MSEFLKNCIDNAKRSSPEHFKVISLSEEETEGFEKVHIVTAGLAVSPFELEAIRINMELIQ